MRILVNYMLAILFSSFLFSCSKEDVNEEPGTSWNKTRTAKIMIVSALAEDNPYKAGNYEAVASMLAKTERNITILDKANVVYGTSMSNTGANIAVLAKQFPVFVPVSKSPAEYTGSSMFFVNTVPNMEQKVVFENCRMMQTETKIGNTLTVKIATLSFNAENQISPAVELLKSAVASSCLVTGTIKRGLIPTLESGISNKLAKETYTLNFMENTDSNSAYCIYVFGSVKWKYREMTETAVADNIKGFMVQVEYLK